MTAGGRIVTVVAAAVALAAAASPARAAVERFAVVIGNDRGEGTDGPLRFAETDAARMADVLGELGRTRPENLVLMRGRDATTLRRALISVNDRIRRAQADGATQAVLIVYYSGHADVDALHLGGTRLEMAELRELVGGSAASFRVLVVDSCRSGGLTRVKGGRTAPPFEIRLEDRLAGEGMVFLTSATSSEDAQESDALGGSFFTHYLVSGLMGAADANGNGQVTLAEAYRHAYENTLRASSRTLLGIQHPTFQYQLRGQGDLPLTFPGEARRGRATIRFPAGRTYLVMRGGADGAVVAEIGAADGDRRLAVAPGSYFVRGRAGDALLEGRIDAGADAEVAVDETRLERIEYARLVRKGAAGVRARVDGVEVGYRVRTPLWSGASACQGMFAGYTHATAAYTLTPRIGYCAGGYDNQRLHSDTDEVDLAAALARAFDVGRLSAGVGIEVGGALLLQRFVTRGVAPPATSAAAHAGVGASVDVAIAAGFYLRADAALQTYLFREQGGGAAHWTASPTLRGQLGVGRFW